MVIQEIDNFSFNKDKKTINFTLKVAEKYKIEIGKELPTKEEFLHNLIHESRFEFVFYPWLILLNI